MRVDARILPPGPEHRGQHRGTGDAGVGGAKERDRRGCGLPVTLIADFLLPLDSSKTISNSTFSPSAHREHRGAGRVSGQQGSAGKQANTRKQEAYQQENGIHHSGFEIDEQRYPLRCHH